MADPIGNILEPGLNGYNNLSWVNNCMLQLGLTSMADHLMGNISQAYDNSGLPLTSSTSSLASSVSTSSSPLSLSFPSSPSLTTSSYGSSSPSLPSSLSNSLTFNPASTLNSTSLESLYLNCTNSTLPIFTEDAFIGSYSALVLEFTKILYGIVCLVGLCGNTLVIYVVLRFSKMQTVTNMYIFNLALADEMFLIGLPFLIATVKYKSWPFGRLMCQIYMITTSINQFTSSLLLTVMSADRYIAVCHPISSPRYRTPFIAKFICLTVWTVSALLMVPIFMYANVLSHEPKNTLSCNIVFPENEYMNGQKAFTLYSFTLGFFIPFILIFLFYFLVICKLRTVGPKNKSKEKKRSHRKVTYLVLTVITVYVGCWLPYWIGQVYITFQKPNVRHSDLCVSILLLAGCLSYANSAVNPILYAFLSDNFKKSFAKAFTCAAGKDVNAALHVENSVFPKTTRGSTKGTTGAGLGVAGNACVPGCSGSGCSGKLNGDPSGGSRVGGETEIAHQGSSFGCNLGSPCQGVYVYHLSDSPSMNLTQRLLVTGQSVTASVNESAHSMDINSFSHQNGNKCITNCSQQQQQLIDHDSEAVTLVNLLYHQNTTETNIIMTDDDDRVGLNHDQNEDNDEDDYDDYDGDDGNNVELINRNKDVHEFISFTPEASQGIINFSCCSDDDPVNDKPRKNHHGLFSSSALKSRLCNGIRSNRSSTSNNNSNNPNDHQHHHPPTDPTHL
ncbi:substance-K receptor-like [Tetranychus urticae]|uniref:G-protein coupled receptors family 1 profile domain-containing protein n=1 Tax=Tetranychus urticae TaxID=32264 RepID=T1JU75_TETUR|nr:substance-K receptor-like [Tetranychus urticae]